MRGLWLAVLFGGCSGDVDLTGMYRVDAAVGSSPCGEDLPVAAPAYLRFSKSQAFGQDYFAYEECADDAGTTCSGPGVLGGFPEPIDDGWKSFASSSSGSDGNCLLGITEKTAILRGRALVVEQRVLREMGLDLPQSQCTPAEAEKRASELRCFAHSLTDATRL